MTLRMLTFLHFGFYENIISEAVYKINWNKDLLSGIYNLVTLYYYHKFDSKKFGNLEEGESANDLRVCETTCKRTSPREIFPFPNRENDISKNEPPE